MVDDLFCLADEPYLDYEQETETVFASHGTIIDIITLKDRKTGKVMKQTRRTTKLKKKNKFFGTEFSWEVSYE